MRILAATVVLTSSLLTTGFIHTSALANNAMTLSQSTPQLQPNKTQPINISKAEFGVVVRDAEGKFNFTPTIRVPLVEGSKYGWRIQIRDVKGQVTWREVLRLPKPPETWATDNGENFTLSADGTEAVTKRTQLPKDGVIENFWTIAPGDPPGKHIIYVYVDDHLVGNFEFEIVPKGNREVKGREQLGKI
ncbi:conserved hypothetical protein [Trichormus variabilis ATCC 29413]|uniref:Uncharacterized protein n=2 Tax=Anabaena variabilis TaxID=264691 RepID=Q3M3L9_TRIV2|nr:MULTISPECIES: hypothetical protein [Nostocaceae]ABA24417.1 conserved hypothetical protein [Trichormus variabilis ATCC 29413]MBC1214444.1 hypothetical protein [Trichormus variabilis ARAD]MBC1258846.1 hypothetical protein [Trichormus variabilis V5]MBC1266637.1 hypothetical protein [Trichormus variabilis FSR]MBC1301559.1 hypothetical protein [Trichormus variabilis N2B]